MPIDQAVGGGLGGVRQIQGLVGLADDQLAAVEYPVTGVLLEVVRALQRDDQATTRRPHATGAGDKTAIQVQAVVGGQADGAAVAGDLHRALPRYIQCGLGAGRFQARPVTHHHKQVAGAGDAGGQVKIATDADLATGVHHAVAAPLVVHGADGAGRHIDHGLFTQPDRAAMPFGIRLQQHLRGHRQAAQADVAAPGVECAVEGQLANAAQVDGLARVDVDHRTLADGQGRGRQFVSRDVRVAGGQVQAGAAPWGQHAFDGVRLIQLGQPARQGAGGVTATGRGTRLVTQVQDRHRHVNLGAVGDEQPFIASDVVGRKALVEKVPGQLQRAGGEGIGTFANQHLLALQGQGAAATHTVTAHLALEAQRAQGAQGGAAAFATVDTAIDAKRGPGGHLHQAARAKAHIAAAAQRDLAAVHVRHTVAATGRVQQQIVPAPRGVQLDTLGHVDLPAARQDHVGHGVVAVEIDLVEHVAQIQAAAVGSQVCVHLDTRCVEGDVAAIGDVECAIDGDALLGTELDRAQLEAIELIGVQHHRALTLGGQCRAQVHTGGDLLRGLLDQHLLRHRRQPITQGAGGLVIDRRVLPDDQLRPLGQRFLGLLITVEVERRCPGLAITLEHVAENLAFQHRA